MPRIPVSDILGIDLDAQIRPGSILSTVSVLASGSALRLNHIPLDTASLGFDFDQPVAINAGGLGLHIGGGANGAIAIVASGARRANGALAMVAWDAGAVEADDPCDGIDVGSDEMYVGLRLTFSGQAGVSF